MKTDIFRPLSQAETHYNARTRFYYKNGEKIWLDTLICDKPVFNPNKVEELNYATPQESNISEDDSETYSADEETALRSARRARNKVFELCLCNEDLQYFVTLTLDKCKIDRKDYSSVIKKLNSWLDYRVRNLGLKYVMVAEYHSNKAIHFHALVNDVLRREDSGTVLIPERDKPVKIATAHRLGSDPEYWQTVYNLPDWKLGFSTCMKCDEGARNHSHVATCGYISKYITKGGKVGGRYYLSGGDLSRPEAIYYNAEYEHNSAAPADGTRKEFEICGTSFVQEKPKTLI